MSHDPSTLYASRFKPTPLVYGCFTRFSNPATSYLLCTPCSFHHRFPPSSRFSFLLLCILPRTLYLLPCMYDPSVSRPLQPCLILSGHSFLTSPLSPCRNQAAPIARSLSPLRPSTPFSPSSVKDRTLASPVYIYFYVLFPSSTPVVSLNRYFVG